MDSENVETLRRTFDAGESDGWPIRSRWFLDRGAALDAAGLPG